MIRPRFTISILSMFDLQKVMRCIGSVLLNSRDYQLVLTDNGAVDGIHEYFDALAEQHKFIRVVHNPRNLGFQFPNQLVLAQCTTPYFITLNDDTEVPPGWLTKLEAVFKSNPRAALVGPMGSPCSLDENFQGYQGHQVEYIEGSCCCAKTELVVQHGLYSDQLKGAYMEDIDLSLRVRELGFSIHLAPFQIVHHRSQTARRVPEVKEWIAHNSRYMQRRWSGYFKLRQFPGEKNTRATLVYIHVPGDRKFDIHAKEFADSYNKNPPGVSHDTLVVLNGAKTQHYNEALFKGLPNLTVMNHDNSGWDIGGYIAAARALKGGTDMMLCCGSQTVFHKPGWLVRFLEAWAKHGPGVYGSCATYQIRPHLNTSGFACAPEMLTGYRGNVVTKRERYDFEHGPDAFWMQMAAAGYSVKLVTFSGEYDWPDWRKPQNIYCRGDQSNCVMWFRMNQEFNRMNPGQKQFMSNLSDKLEDRHFMEQLKPQLA